MLRIDHDVLVFFDNIDDVEFDTQLLRAPQGIVSLRFFLVFFTNGMGMAFDAKAGIEVDALDMNALFQHQPGSEQGIEAPGDKGNGFSGSGHCSSVCF